jgi:ABC-2 type transport system permease protein
MLRILVKKQLAEVFKSYFYDAKKNRMRSKLAIAGWIVFFKWLDTGGAEAFSSL